ncbi:MAG: anthranilate synthase component [Desulfovibrionales bacterium]|jgi:anthranilate synthase component 1|nr:anthranilate synthase component [Desulfovibrionales bacterium]
MEPITLRQHGVWLPADIQTPISLYLGLVGDAEGVLLESAEVDGRWGRYSFIGWDPRLALRQDQGRLAVDVRDDRLAPLAALDGSEFLPGLKEALRLLDVKAPEGQEKLPAATRALFGTLGFGLASHFEPKLAPLMDPADAEACLILPGRLILFDHLKHQCCLLSLEPAELPSLDHNRMSRRMGRTALGEITADPGREEYCSAVSKAREMITQGEAIQVVLSTRFEASFEGEPFDAYRRLRQVNPSPFMFYMRLPGETLLGSSPELLVQSEQGRIEVRPIAGTRPRGKNEAEDKALTEELLADPKERAEHVMLVDLGRNDLGRMAEAGTVEVVRFMQPEYFSHVIHLTSYVEADLREGLDAVDVLAASFPAGTVSGAPKIRAMEIIAELEGRKRGPYAGAIGWLGVGDNRANVETGITIRSMWIKDGVCRWQAGAGIVYDSQPEKEWLECNNKARVLKEILSAEEDGDVLAYR